MQIELIQKFVKFNDAKKTHDVDTINFLNSPIFSSLSILTLVKDVQGKYLSGNDLTAKVAGFEKGSDLVGLTDFDMAWRKEAELAREHDEHVKRKKQAISFIENGAHMHTGALSRYACLKTPLYGKSDKISGVIGVAFFLEEIQSSIMPFSVLSKQQRKCLYYLAKGMTMKEIGHVLELSPKTVEHYLDTVKMKLNCHSRSELIAYAINAGILK